MYVCMYVNYELIYNCVCKYNFYIYVCIYISIYIVQDLFFFFCLQIKERKVEYTVCMLL